MATGNLASVVVAVDGSEESMSALRWALDNLRLRPDGALVVLHVQPPPSIAAGLNPGPIPFGGPSDVEVPAFTQAIEAHQRRITQAILDHALKICSEKNLEVKTEVVVGDPKEKICEVTANLKADLLVMGCRAIGPLKRMFLGSVSNYCINNVGCPVVVIKEKDGDLSEKFWSTKDPGQQPFSFNIGLGSVIKGWDKGVVTMQVGEVVRIQCTPDYAYGAGGFPAWGIKPNSVLIFEIEVLSAQ